MSNAVQRLVVKGMKRQERLLGTPVFEWDHTQVYAAAATPPVKEIPCLPSYEQGGTLIDGGGGNLIEVDFALLVRRELFITWDSTEVTWDSEDITWDDNTPVPRSGQIVRYLGRRYKVLMISWSPENPSSHAIFYLVDPESGR